MSMGKAFLPKNLEIESLVSLNPPRFSFSNAVENIKYILSTIIRLKVSFKDYHESEYVPLNASILQSKIRDYNKYLAYLLDLGIIEVYKDGHFIQGVSSRKFKIADKYMTEGCVVEEVYEKKSKEEIYVETQFNKKYDYLTKWFNKALSIDMNGAYHELENLLLQETNGGMNIDVKSHNGISPSERFNLRLSNARLIKEGMYYLSVDDNIKRFHSNLTNLKSELRKHITYNGQELTSVDVKNSQPFISTILFNPSFYNKSKTEITLYSLKPSIYNTLRNSIHAIQAILQTTTGSSPLITLVKDSISQCSSNIELYCTLVDKGLFYSYYSDAYYDKTKIRLNVDVLEQKRKLKEGLFTTFFSDNKFFRQKDAEMKRLFAELFPDVYKVFCIIKSNGNHNLLAIILQLIESEIIVRRVAPRIAKEVPELPIFTIHDSIVTLSSHKEYAKSILKDEFSMAIGLMPNLSFETWKQTN